MAADELGTLFTRPTARAAGFSDGQIRLRIATGRWFFVVGHVLAAAGCDVTPRLRDKAALMAIPDGVLNGPSAARWHGIETGDEHTWVTVPTLRRVRVGGVRIRREPLPDEDIVRLPDGVVVTGVSRAVFDCTRSLPLDRAERLMHRALDEGWTSYEEFLHRVGQHAGRHGMAHLVALVSRLAHSRQVDPVAVLADRLHRAGITGWRTHQRVRGEAVDLFFNDGVRLAIDCGGGAWHNRLVRAGWTVLRYSRAQVVEQTDEVVAEVIAVRDHLLNAEGRR